MHKHIYTHSKTFFKRSKCLIEIHIENSLLYNLEIDFSSLLNYTRWPHWLFLKLGIYFIYISNAIPKVPHPPTPTSWPCRSPVLRHIKFARPMGLSFHWWPTRPSSDTCAARDTSSGEYWLVHIVVPPIGLQIPLAPWVLSLAPPLGALWSIQ